jgi:hypothetical protein
LFVQITVMLQVIIFAKIIQLQTQKTATEFYGICCLEIKESFKMHLMTIYLPQIPNMLNFKWKMVLNLL